MAGDESLLEQAATGLENFGQAYTAKLGPRLGPEQVARQAKYPKTAATGQVLGDTARALTAVGLAGPMGLFGNGALTVAGNTQDYAYSHDPSLTREFLKKEVFSELLSDTLQAAFPWAASGLKAGGKWVAGKALASAGDAIAPYAERYLANGGKLGELAERAMKSGFFTKAKAAATDLADQNIGQIDSHLDVYHQSLDAAGPLSTAPAALKGYTAALKNTESKLVQTRPSAARAVKSILSDLQDPQIAPSAMLRAEGRLQAEIEAASKAGDGYVVQTLNGLKSEFVSTSDQLMAQSGIHAPSYRELQQTREGWSALKVAAASQPEAGLGKQLLQRGAKAAGAAALGAVAGPQGAAAGAALAASGLGQSTNPALIRSLANSARQAAYGVGTGFSEFEKRAFAQGLGDLMATQATTAMTGAARVTGALLTRPSIDATVNLLTAHAQQPDAVKRHIATFLDGTPLPQEYKDLGLGEIDLGLSSAHGKLPDRVKNPNPLSPPSSRALNTDEKRRVMNYMHGLVDPIAVLNHPTLEGIEAVRNHYPATYKRFSANLVQRLGPNAPINAPLRSLAEKHSLSDTLRINGLLVQSLYDQAKQPPSPPQGNKNTSRAGGGGNSSRVTNAGTAQSQQQERQGSGQ